MASLLYGFDNQKTYKNPFAGLVVKVDTNFSLHEGQYEYVVIIQKNLGCM